MQTSTPVLIKLHYFSVNASVILKALVVQRFGSPADFFRVREKTTENHPKRLWVFEVSHLSWRWDWQGFLTSDRGAELFLRAISSELCVFGIDSCFLKLWFLPGWVDFTGYNSLLGLLPKCPRFYSTWSCNVLAEYWLCPFL